MSEIKVCQFPSTNDFAHPPSVVLGRIYFLGSMTGVDNGDGYVASSYTCAQLFPISRMNFAYSMFAGSFAGLMHKFLVRWKIVVLCHQSVL